MRCFDTVSLRQTQSESATTIEYTDSRVESWFKPLPDGHERVYTQFDVNIVSELSAEATYNEDGTLLTEAVYGDVSYPMMLPSTREIVIIPPTVEELQALAIAHLKTLYLGVVNAKLKELDYDSLATVKLWEGDPSFGAEATKILTWYKAIITYNYSLITAGTIPTDEAYLSGLPVYV